MTISCQANACKVQRRYADFEPIINDRRDVEIWNNVREAGNKVDEAQANWAMSC